MFEKSARKFDMSKNRADPSRCNISFPLLVEFPLKNNAKGKKSVERLNYRLQDFY